MTANLTYANALALMDALEAPTAAMELNSAEFLLLLDECQKAAESTFEEMTLAEFRHAYESAVEKCRRYERTC